jgi:hypothetical protein
MTEHKPRQMPDLAKLYPGYASRWIDTSAAR